MAKRPNLSLDLKIVNDEKDEDSFSPSEDRIQRHDSDSPSSVIYNQEEGATSARPDAPGAPGAIKMNLAIDVSMSSQNSEDYESGSDRETN